MNDEDAVLARKQTDGENEDDYGERILTRRFCHRYDNEDRMLQCLRLAFLDTATQLVSENCIFFITTCIFKATDSTE